MEHQDPHRPLGDSGLTRRSRLTRPQWSLLAGVALLLLALELLLVYAYLGIGRAGDRYEDKGASAALMANVQRETLQLALQTSRRGEGLDTLHTQRDLLQNQLTIARAGATDATTTGSLAHIRALLTRYDGAVRQINSGQGGAGAERRLTSLLDEIELEAKRGYDRAELAFYQNAGKALETQQRSQAFLLGIGALLLLLAVPLAISLHRVFDTQLKRLSAFPRLSPFPVVELAQGEIRFANAATRELARRFSDGDVGGLLPGDWPTLAPKNLRELTDGTASREVKIRDRTVSWSFFPVAADGVVHGYGDDVTDRKRAEEELRNQSAVSEHQAQHDALTSLGNRRKLMEDGERRLPAVTADTPLVLAIFDLDGFKSYNDTFGHPAGDALLSRLGGRLRNALPGEASAYRMGGDEFCVLADATDPDPIVTVACEALHEEGDAFTVGASVGFALVPTEARTIEQALHLADQRLYTNKRSSRAWAGAQARDALLQVLVEQDPRLSSHVNTVAHFAAVTAASLGLDEDEVARVRLAAELHDIGKAAIPDTILEKPGPLDHHEWEFVKRHTMIGERILGAAPALASIAPLVRSTHERLDGTGYPDGLSGEEIPLPARIVAIADAFDAMVTERPYRAALSFEDALAELRRCAGTQFDPNVVEAFVAIVEDWAALAA